MRQTISGLVAAFAVVAASAAPAMACGETPCGQVYIPAPVYSGCYTGCGGWGYERLPDPVQQYYSVEQYPVHQYYYVNQGPTFYRSRRLRALSDLPGRRGVRLERLSPPSQLPLRICPHPLHHWDHHGLLRAAHVPSLWLRLSRAHAPLLLIAISERRFQRPFAPCERAFCFSAHQAEPASADIERQHRGIGDVEALDLAGHVEPRHHAAGLARQLPQALAFGAEHQRQRLPQRHGAEVFAALAVEADGHETLVVQFGECARPGFAR